MAHQKTTVYLDADVYRRLKRIAQDKQCPPAQLGREAVADYAARYTPRARARSVGTFSSGGRNLSERAEDLLGGLGKAR